jgi:hypothetical protein
MIFLFAGFIVFFFLAVGSIAFVACVLIPPWRKYALSTALWFAAWGPCCAFLLILAILGLIAGGLVLQKTGMRWEDAPKLLSAVGWTSVLGGGIFTCAIASVAARLHQALIHRFTFMLFRLYVTFVSAGIGSVFGWLSLWLAMMWSPFPHAVWLAAFTLPILMLAFGATAYRHARVLRGDAPTSFTWISSEEFAGPLNS